MSVSSYHKKDEDLLGNALTKSTKKSGIGRSSNNNKLKNQQRHSTTIHSNNTSNKSNVPKCSFCNISNAAVLIHKSLTSQSTPFCLLHYYTTRASRVDPSKVKPITTTDENENNLELKVQLPYIKDLFSEAFLELQKEISLESATSMENIRQHSNDPLGFMLRSSNNKMKNSSHQSKSSSFKQKQQHYQQDNHTTEQYYQNEGGFMKPVESMELKLIHQQNQNYKYHSQQDESQNQLLFHPKRNLPKKDVNEVNPYKRRKGSKKSIWNLALMKDNEDDNNNNNNKGKEINTSGPTAKATTNDYLSQLNNTHTICESCESSNVGIDGNVMSRTDIAKAETWGSKRESDVVIRYKCLDCGSMWNEEE